MENDEIYNILMSQLLRVARKYDPFYSDKIRRIVEVLDEKRKVRETRGGRSSQVFIIPVDEGKEFSIAELNTKLDFDGTRLVRVLCRHGFLEAAPEPTQGDKYCGDRVHLYQRTDKWPPPPGYLSAGQIGFTYYLQMWFRYYLQQHIESVMRQIETREGMYSLDFHRHKWVPRRAAAVQQYRLFAGGAKPRKA